MFRLHRPSSVKCLLSRHTSLNRLELMCARSRFRMLCVSRDRAVITPGPVSSLDGISSIVLLSWHSDPFLSVLLSNTAFQVGLMLILGSVFKALTVCLIQMASLIFLLNQLLSNSSMVLSSHRILWSIWSAIWTAITFFWSRWYTALLCSVIWLLPVSPIYTRPKLHGMQ